MLLPFCGGDTVAAVERFHLLPESEDEVPAIRILLRMRSTRQRIFRGNRTMLHQKPGQLQLIQCVAFVLVITRQTEVFEKYLQGCLLKVLRCSRLGYEIRLCSDFQQASSMFRACQRIFHDGNL